jgi:RND superfamily putative drug exporter
VELDRRTTLIQVFPEGRPHWEEAQDLTASLRTLDTPLAFSVSGASANFADFKDQIFERLPLALAVMGLSMLVLLFLMTGSVVLPFKSLVINVLTLCASFGYLTFVFGEGRLTGLFDYTATGGIDIVIAIVLLGLIFGIVTDYTVFLLSRIREEHLAGATNQEAIARGMQTTGRLVTSAALLFCVAVGSLLASSQVTMKEAGTGVAFAVILDATIVRAGLVPALMRLMGDWNWWAPRSLRHLHERLGLGEREPAETAPTPVSPARSM